MKKVMVILASAMVLSAVLMVALAGEKVIDVARLPQKAQTFIKSNYSKGKVALVKMEKDVLSTEYEVAFSDGSIVEFDGNGEWTDIKSPVAVPSKLVPARISFYLKSNGYGNGAKVVKIGKDRRGGYEVELSNGQELEFDKNFRLTDIDD